MPLSVSGLPTDESKITALLNENDIINITATIPSKTAEQLIGNSIEQYIEGKSLSDAIIILNWAKGLSLEADSLYDTYYYDEVINILSREELEWEEESISRQINTNKDEYWPCPVYKANGRRELYFTRDHGKNRIQEDIFHSKYNRKIDVWSEPVPIDRLNQKKINDAIFCVSSNGKRMLVYKSKINTPNESDLYISEYVNDDWTKPKKLPFPINIEDSFEGGGYISDDGSLIIFSSDRKGGIGEYKKKSRDDDDWGNQDLYIAFKNPNGGWSEAINIESLNTPGAELTPFLSNDMGTLYFSSSGHPGLGGTDVFKVNRTNQDSWVEWSEPYNLGRHLNTIYNDEGFKISPNEIVAYLDAKNTITNNRDIYIYNNPNVVKPTKSTNKIEISVTDIDDQPMKSIPVNIENAKTQETIAREITDEDGNISIDLNEDHKNIIITVDSAEYYPSSEYISEELENIDDLDSVSKQINKIIHKQDSSFVRDTTTLSITESASVNSNIPTNQEDRIPQNEDEFQHKREVSEFQEALIDSILSESNFDSIDYYSTTIIENRHQKLIDSTIIDQLSQNIDSLEKIIVPLFPLVSDSVKYIWPVTSSDTNQFQNWAISVYYDHNQVLGELEDYSCLNQTYDLVNAKYNHSGTDIFLWPFSWDLMEKSIVDVISAADGYIIFKHDGEYDKNCSIDLNYNSNLIGIVHLDGSTTIYCHLKKGSLTNKDVGDFVEQGEKLGVIGSSGPSTGPHLHFEVHDLEGNIIDPFNGTCSNTSKWLDQKPYSDSGINHIHTHRRYPIFRKCPKPEITYSDRYFFQGDSMLFGIYYRDILSGAISTNRIIDPFGNLIDEWTWQNGDDYSIVKSVYFRNVIDRNAIPGIWTFQVVFDSTTYNHTYHVNEGIRPVAEHIADQFTDEDYRKLVHRIKLITFSSFDVMKSPDYLCTNQNIVRFGFNKWNLDDVETLNTLDRIAQFIINNNIMDIKIIGYTDSQGRADDNQDLSILRANRVREHFENNYEIKNIKSVGRGENDLITDLDGKEIKSLSRRVEICLR